MVNIQKNKNGGFIKMIIILIIVIATLSYFKINIGSVVKSEPVQAVWGFTKTLTTNYIEPAGVYVWDKVLRDFIFKDVVSFFKGAQKQISTTNIKDIINSTTTSPTLK